MALDPSIILGGQPPQNIADQYGKAIQLRAFANQGRLQDLQYDQALQQSQQNKTLRDLYAGNIDANGQINRAGVLQGAASQGLGDRIPELQKSWADSDKSQVDLSNSQFDLARKRVDATNGALASLLSNPNVTHDDVAQAFAGLAQNGLITDDMAVKAIRSLPGPDQLRPFLVRKAMESLEIGKQLEMQAPKFEKIDAGGQVVTGTVDPQTGQFTRAGSIQKSASPDSMLNAQTQRELADRGVTFQTDGRGNIVALPNRAPAGAPVVATPVMDSSGQPVTGKDSGLTDTQAKALLFGSRMREANTVLEQLAEKGVDRPGNTKALAEAVPGIGGMLGTAVNATQSGGQQQVEQAQRDFINAVLRRESGAAIAPSEFENAKRQYFPEIGDSEPVKKQKATNRQLAIDGLLAEVPAARRNSLQGSGAARLQPPSGGGAIPIKSDADYEQLPSGTVFIDPDGNQRVKP